MLKSIFPYFQLWLACIPSTRLAQVDLYSVIELVNNFNKQDK